MAKKIIRDYVFAPGGAGAGTVKIPGRYTLDQILLITNVTDNVILYSFAGTAYAGTSTTFTAADDATNFPAVTQRYDGFTTITLGASTTGQSSGDSLQIFVDESESTGVIVRPWNFGTDAIERMRVSNPESLIDADFEYGLQPTKWAGYGTTRGYPSVYDLPGVDLTVTAITTDYNQSNGTNSLITITFSGSHNLVAGNVVNVNGLNKGITNFSAADGSFILQAAPSGTTVTYFARGLVGTANGQSLFTSVSVVKRGAIYSGATIPVTSAASNGATPSVITVTTTSAHGLIPGTNIHISFTTGTNAVGFASGPFTIASVPSTTTFTYTARAGAAVSSPGGTITLYAVSNSSVLHRPQDGGVILETRSPTYGANVVRVSKKYFRYQSGKGFLWSTGTLFKPNYDIQSVTASGTTGGSTITVTTDDINHGLQIGGQVRLEGITTSGYNGTYTVASITNDYTFTVTAAGTLGATTAVLDFESKVFVTGWHGAIVRAGVFDDQNGVFWEYDGSTLSVVRRSSTFQVSGTVAATLNSNAITGTNTRFTQQVKVGDKIVIRGMSHYVTNVTSDTGLTVSPDYRGANASGIKASLTRDTRIRQVDFNYDTIDGNGPSGFNVDLNKMQMIGIQFSWYGAGFIDYMIRGGDGNWVTAHRVKNNNVNNEAYMRSGNLPVRYSIENDGANSSLTGNMTNSQNTVPLADLTYFPSAGTIYVDNELISYTGKSASTGAGNLTGATRAATLTQYNQGSSRSLTAAAAATHNSGTGVILVSNTCSPTLSHWGSAMIMDGGVDEDRGYIFNYQRTGISLTTSNVTAFVIRLSPSVENSLVGLLGERSLLNRSQLLLQAVGATMSAGTNPGAVIVEGVLNPRNFTSATWGSLNLEAAGGQPSFAQVATSVTWSTGTFALPGEQVFAFAGPSVASGAVSERLELGQLKELTGSPLGGDFKYPDGPDVLAINIRLTSGTGTGHVLLRWSEAQA